MNQRILNLSALAMIRRYLAIYNFGMFALPSADPANDGFHARNDANFISAESSGGFVARSGYADEPGPESWGEQVYPRFYADNGDGWSPSTLSLWEDIPSLMAFCYSGIHAEAMRHAREWFVDPAWPPYVLWWTEPGAFPLWSEGAARLEHLHDNGPCPSAFTFKQPYDTLGRPITIDRAAVRRKISENHQRCATGRPTIA